MDKEKLNKEISPASLEHKIFIVRGEKVILDFHLAGLYQVPTMRLNEQVKRNKDRFPLDFMFQLTILEHKSLISQFAISKMGRGGTRKSPHAFTEHGVAMLSSVLHSQKAIQMNIFIIRAFIKLREMLIENKDLAHKVDQLEYIQEKQGEKLDQINDVVIQLIGAKAEPKDPIGFKTSDDQ